MGAKVTTPFRSVKFGDWLARNNNTVYQAATDGIVHATANYANLQGLTDNANPPITERRRWDAGGYGEPVGGITFAVKKGDYWKVNNANLYVWWISLENIWGLY